MRVYVVFSTDDLYELPVYVFDSLAECSALLNVSRDTIRTAIYRHKVYRGAKYCVEKVLI